MIEDKDESRLHTIEAFSTKCEHYYEVEGETDNGISVRCNKCPHGMVIPFGTEVKDGEVLWQK